LNSGWKSGISCFSSQEIGSSLASLEMIFEALQSELFRFKFHSLCWKILKFPEFNLVIHERDRILREHPITSKTSHLLPEPLSYFEPPIQLLLLPDRPKPDKPKISNPSRNDNNQTDYYSMHVNRYGIILTKHFRRQNFEQKKIEKVIRFLLRISERDC